MNRFERAVKSTDAWQQNHRVPAFAYAVFKKFGDDEAGSLVALLTYYAFLATFPLMLAFSGILGLVLRGNPELQASIQSSALAEFPIIGTQLKSQVGITSLGHSGPALVIGIVGAILGGRGLANAMQSTLNSVWNVPRKDRPGFPFNYFRSFGLLGILGLGAVSTTAAGWLAGAGHILGVSGLSSQILALALSAIIDFSLFLAAFRLAAAKTIATRDLILGAILSSIAWQILLMFGAIIISHQLKHAQAIAGFFGIVLGLLAWFGLQATVTVYAMEADVVRTRHLWPRAIFESKDQIQTRQSTEGNN